MAGTPDKLNSDAKFANWVLNACLVTVFLGAWAVERWPHVLWLELAVVGVACLVGLATLGIVKYREYSRVGYAKRETQDEARRVVAPLPRLETSLLWQVAANKAMQSYFASHQRVVQKDQDRLLLNAMFSENLFEYHRGNLSPRQFSSAHMRQAFVSYTKNEKRHIADIVLNTASDDYNITIGLVRIEVRGGEAKVSVGGPEAPTGIQKTPRSELEFIPSYQSLSKAIH